MLKGIILPTADKSFLLGRNTTNVPDTKDPVVSLEIASDIHKQVRQELYPMIKPGAKLIDLAQFIERRTCELAKHYNTLNRGIGFPVGFSINSCAAHYHPYPGDLTKLSKDDIVKIDFGVEVNGWIIDSAFTVYFNDCHEKLAKAVREATYTGIKNAAIDVDINEWANEIKEVMESYDVHPIRNLGGHNILNGLIHGEYFLPAYPSDYLKHKRFSEGVYAIETFGSTEEDIVQEVGEPAIYRVNPYMNPAIKLDSTRKLFNQIKQSFKTLPFSTRFLEKPQSNFKTQLNILAGNKNIIPYPPMLVSKGNTAQYEHTIYLGEDGRKRVFSNGEDY